MPERGEVWWYEPEHEKRRPYLILTRSEAIEVLTFVIGVPLTSTVRGIRSEVLLGPDDGLPVECVVSLDNIRSVQRSLLTNQLTVVSPLKMQSVCDALKFVVAC